MLTILHTNDLHGALGLLPRLTALVARERARAPHTVLLDAGDTALGDPTADLGVDLLAALGYDAMTPGNAETEVVECRRHLGRIGVPVVVANVASGALGSPTVPALVRTVGGIRLAILGLATPPVYPAGHPLHRRNAQEVPVHDAVATALHWVPQLHAAADLVVVVSHLGLWRDLELATTVPDIDLIIGGHSHHRLPSLLPVGRTAIAQAGVGGAYLGVITVSRGAGGWQCSGRLEPVWQALVPDVATERAIRRYLRQRLPDALQRVGETAGCWADPWAENPWSNFVNDRLRAAAGTDVCLYNASGLFPALDPGPVTRWDLERAVPYLPANEAMGVEEIVAMTLTGEELQAVLEHSVGNLPYDLAAEVPHAEVPHHLCWPGSTFLQVSGLRVAADLRRPPGQRVTALTVAGVAVEPQRRYTVATSGFLARGYSGFRWLREGSARRQVGAERQVLLAALRDAGPLPDCDGRLQVTST
jgi:2',3'-cyclic-nucleotide 2'-phosphodiesterase (5'-nucleotidase family)